MGELVERERLGQDGHEAVVCGISEGRVVRIATGDYGAELFPLGVETAEDFEAANTTGDSKVQDESVEGVIFRLGIGKGIDGICAVNSDMRAVAEAVEEEGEGTGDDVLVFEDEDTLAGFGRKRGRGIWSDTGMLVAREVADDFGARAESGFDADIATVAANYGEGSSKAEAAA